MQTGEARRSERVHYRGAVELHAGEGVIDASSVLAQAVDLGEGGMRISTPIEMPVGAAVTCRVELDGREASLPGKVAWLAHGDGSNGIGICFDPLGSYESALLQHMVERSRTAYRPVELRFAGVDPPIRARARAKTNGLRLSAVLPILARGTELSFRLDEEGPQFTGRVSEASLHEEHGVRRLDVDVDVLDRDCVRFRRRARYGYAIEIEAAEHREAMAMPLAHDEAKVSDPTPRRRGSWATRITALMVAAASGGLVGWAAARSSASPAQAAQVDRPAVVQYAQTAATPRLVSVVARPPWRASIDQQTSAPLQPARDQPRSASTSDSAKTAPIEAAPVQPDLQVQPDVRVDGEVTRVLVPFEGDLDQMQARLWASPFALAIDLPHGRTRLAQGLHPLQAGSADDLRIQRRDDGTELIRLKLATPLAHYAVTVQDGTLELLLVRHPAIAATP